MPQTNTNMLPVTPNMTEPQYQMEAIGTALGGRNKADTSGSWFGNGSQFGGLGMNLGTLQGVLGGIGAIGNIYNGFQANRLARQQFNFARDVTNTNMVNQIRAYNTALEDRITSRTHTQGGDPRQAEAYIEQNRARR